MSVFPPPLLLLAISAIVVRGGSAAYCDEHLFQKHEGLQFTKELSGTEYGPLSSFKTLHCCGEKYLSLEWFKDNRPYPWPGDVSSFILNPESANQTIYTLSLTSSDHGVYTCQLANQTNTVNHSIKLVTLDVPSYWGEPLSTYQMPKTQYAEPEDSVRLYCEGFVGNVDLPDAVNKITWKKIGGNQTMESNDNYRIEKIIREDNQVLGEILFIKHIKEMDYGQYMCSISNSDDQMLQQFINITKPVLNNTQSEKKVHRDLELIIFVMLALILIFSKRRWFYTEYQKLKKTFVNDKYALSKRTVHNVLVFHDEENKESAQYLVKNMENRDNYITKKCHIEFDEDFVKTHVDLIKGYDFAIYLLSSEDIIASSFMKKSTQKSLTQDNASPKKYIINCGNMPVTPTRSWCDRVLEDLSAEDNKRNDKTATATANKRLIRIV